MSFPFTILKKKKRSRVKSPNFITSYDDIRPRTTEIVIRNKFNAYYFSSCDFFMNTEKCTCYCACH